MLIRNIQELKRYVTVSDQINVDDLQPIMENFAEPKYLADILGTELLALLNEKVNSSEASVTGKLKDVLNLSRNVVAQYTMGYYIPSGRVKLSNNGITVQIDENTRSASAEQVAMLRRQYEYSLNVATETLYAYLEANKDDSGLVLWKNSAAYTLLRSNFINSATEFNNYVYINSSRLLFNRLRPLIDEVEKKCIKPVLGTALFDDLKTKVLNGTALSAKEKSAMGFICRAVAKGAIADSIPEIDLQLTPTGIQLKYFTQETDKTQTDTPADMTRLMAYKRKLEEDRDSYLDSLFKYIEANASDFTGYTAVGVSEEPVKSQGGIVSI